MNSKVFRNCENFVNVQPILKVGNRLTLHLGYLIFINCLLYLQFVHIITWTNLIRAFKFCAPYMCRYPIGICLYPYWHRTDFCSPRRITSKANIIWPFFPSRLTINRQGLVFALVQPFSLTLTPSRSISWRTENFDTFNGKTNNEKTNTSATVYQYSRSFQLVAWARLKISLSVWLAFLSEQNLTIVTDRINFLLPYQQCE